MFVDMKHPLGSCFSFAAALQFQSGGDCKIWWKWCCSGSLCLVWLGCVLQVQPSSTPAGFLFACSLSVFIYGLHLARLSACRSPTAALSSCWTSISLGEAPWYKCENSIFSHKEQFIANYCIQTSFILQIKIAVSKKHLLLLLPEWVDLNSQFISTRFLNVQFLDSIISTILK